MSGKSGMLRAGIASYVMVRGVAGVAPLFLSRLAPSSPAISIIPLLVVGAVLLMIGYGVFRARPWGWSGSVAATLILLATTFFLEVDTIPERYLISSDILALTAMLYFRKVLQGEEEVEKVTLEDLRIGKSRF